MTIPPDTKNWTWVLLRACPECGFDASTFRCQDVAAALRVNASSWGPLLGSDTARRRPSEAVWSALEYGCHVRDVFRIFDKRLNMMLTQDDPLFENWDQDQTAVEEHYENQDPSVVTHELEIAGAALAARFETVKAADWTRPGRRSDGSAFTIDSFARYLLHDPVHHLHDVSRGFEQIRGTAAPR